MRDIIFRGKRIDNGEWVRGCLLEVSGVCIIYFGNQTKTDTQDIPHDGNVIVKLIQNESAVVDPLSIGQFTGLIDCMGEDIYEDDIIEYSDPNIGVVRTEVIYCDGATCTEGGAYLLYEFANQCNIIGNRHDCPNILK